MATAHFHHRRPASVNVLASPGQCTGGVAVARVSTWMNSKGVIARPAALRRSLRLGITAGAVLRPAHRAGAYIKRRRRHRQAAAKVRRFGLRRSCDSRAARRVGCVLHPIECACVRRMDISTES